MQLKSYVLFGIYDNFHIDSIVEGMQIALLNMPKEELQSHSIAYINCQLTFSGQNLQAFLIRHQICITICMFVVAHITTLNIEIGVDDNNWCV